MRGLITEFKATQAKRANYRRTFNELSNLSDRDLSDLGFSRYDIADVAYQHVYGN